MQMNNRSVSVGCLKLKFERKLDRARAADLIQRIEAAIRAAGAQAAGKGLRRTAEAGALCRRETLRLAQVGVGIAEVWMV